MIGTTISRYRILEEIGEGGFGLVYLAEQTEPVRRRVALKVVKAGMDTRSVLARFEAERQALALMDHPNIARVLDAGEAGSGRPFFVMELVKGDPLNVYCDRHRLTVRERLELFVPICQAVQHAHQKGVIHRDLKPSNILVTVVDGQPVPKVIDFGIAKAISRPLTDLTLLTAQGEMIGTPAYMSPEQAERSTLDVDTTTDVYSLGVILYELLSGYLPYDIAELSDVGLTGIPRVIREVDPPPPSARYGRLERESLSIAGRRRTEPQVLAHQIRGELDWIVMRAMAKDRTQRYQTANALALEIRRFLRNEPIEAGPPNTTYRLRKFAQRYRMALSLALAVVLGLAISAAGLTVALVHSQRQRDAVEAALAETARARDAADQARSESEAVTDFLADMFAAVDPARMGRDVTVREVLDATAATIVEECPDFPLIRARLQTVMGATYRELGEHATAEQLLQAGLTTRSRLLGGTVPATLASLREIGQLRLEEGRYAEAESIFTSVLSSRRSLLGADDPQTLTSLVDLAAVHLMRERDAEAVPLLEEALHGARRIDDPLGKLRQSCMSGLSVAYTSLGRYAEAEPLLVELLAVERDAYGDDDARVAATRQNLGRLYRTLGRYDDAVPLYERSVATVREVYGEEHPTTLRYRNNLALLYMDMERYPEAERLFLQVIEARRRLLGPDNPGTLASQLNLAILHGRTGEHRRCESLVRGLLEVCPGIVGEDHLYTLLAEDLLGTSLVEQDRPAEGEPILATTLARWKTAYPLGHWRVGAALHSHGHALARLRRFAEAEVELLEGFGILEAALGADHRHTRQAVRSIQELYEAWGKPDEARSWGERLVLAAF